MTTSLTIEPAFAECMTNASWMNGIAVNGKTVVRVPYIPSWWFIGIPDPWGFFTHIARDQLNTLLLAHISDAGGVEVWGHSQGAQVIYDWLRVYGPTSSADPTKVHFYSNGNPERKYGGVLGMLQGPPNAGAVQATGWTGGVHTPPQSPPSNAVNVELGQLPGIPAGNRYTVIDFARQYDFFADYPTVANPLSVAATNASQAIHSSYYGVTPFDSANVSYGPENNVTYVWSPTHPTPSTGNAWYASVAQRATDETNNRPVIESQYTRPVTIP